MPAGASCGGVEFGEDYGFCFSLRDKLSRKAPAGIKPAARDRLFASQPDARSTPDLRWPVWLTSITRPCSSIARWKRSSP